MKVFGVSGFAFVLAVAFANHANFEQNLQAAAASWASARLCGLAQEAAREDSTTGSLCVQIHLHKDPLNRAPFGDYTLRPALSALLSLVHVSPKRTDRVTMVIQPQQCYRPICLDFPHRWLHPTLRQTPLARTLNRGRIPTWLIPALKP